MSKILDNGQVMTMFVMRMEGVSLRAIADEVDCSRQYALNVLNRQAYSDVPIPDRLINIAANHVPLKRAKAVKRTEQIIALYNKGYAQVEIAQKLGCGTATVCRTLKPHK